MDTVSAAEKVAQLMEELGDAVVELVGSRIDATPYKWQQLDPKDETTWPRESWPGSPVLFLTWTDWHGYRVGERRGRTIHLSAVVRMVGSVDVPITTLTLPLWWMNFMPSPPDIERWKKARGE